MGCGRQKRKREGEKRVMGQKEGWAEVPNRVARIFRIFQYKNWKKKVERKSRERKRGKRNREKVLQK